ncbi:hypothetical protein BJ170DRAFT_645781 [Xylariales sp. AK1849]|nr:hypothetical protein BJ170DRAFT_645781 [Xylariales sp. AK1849]
MTPPCQIFESGALERQIQSGPDGKKRKTEGGRDIDLSQCPLFGMVQYECQIDRPELPSSPVRCWPVQRWFRRCQDKKGSFMVETTNWEGRQEKAPSPSNADDEKMKSRPRDDGWMHSWREREMGKQGQYHDI